MSTYCYDLNRRAFVNLRDCLECSRIHRDGNALGLPPKNLRIEGGGSYKSGEPETEREIIVTFCRWCCECLWRVKGTVIE
jgi:hypothetical protein